MEKWKEYKKGQIPKDRYIVEMKNGEEDGLYIKLIGFNNTVNISFGCVLGVRMLDEGVVIDGFYSQNAVDEHKADEFENIIYTVEQGAFKKEITASARGYCPESRVKHFILITENFIIDVVTEWEPEISVTTF